LIDRVPCGQTDERVAELEAVVRRLAEDLESLSQRLAQATQVEEIIRRAKGD
jgi:prefoldin subunit 5